MRTASLIHLMVFTLFWVFSPRAMAESSKDYAVMARATWSAFECSSLASKSKNLSEQERLFLFGYDQGQKFIAALKAEKITQEDLTSKAPLIVLLLLQGPTPDFMLGRIFEAAQNSALEDIHKLGGSTQDQKLFAENEFRKRNCQLIGKQK